MEVDTEADVISSKLPLQARCLLLGITIPLVLIVLFLALTQVRKERLLLLQALNNATESQAMVMGAVANSAVGHVNQMKDWSESFMAAPPRAQSSWRVELAARRLGDHSDGFVLDGLTKEQQRRSGQLVGLATDPRQRRQAIDALDLGLELMSVARLAHEHSRNFQWSYFFSAEQKFVAIYPWVRSDVFVERQGHASMLESIPKWFDYEIFSSGTPSANPKKQLYWTAPYLDAGGAGAMVSLGAPVYHNGAFKGVVGTDVRIERLQQLISSLPRAAGRLILVAGDGYILADSRSSALVTKKLDQGSMPVNEAELVSRALRAPGLFQAAEGTRALAKSVEATPWKLVVLIDDQEIFAILWPHLIPYLVMLSILGFNFFVALLLLKRHVINPALELASLISRVSCDTSIVPPSVSYYWQPLVAKVVGTIEQLRTALKQLEQSEAFKSAIVDRSMLAIISTDAKGQIVAFNAAAEHAFGTSAVQARKQHLSAIVDIPDYVAENSFSAFATYVESGGRKRELFGRHSSGARLVLEVATSMASVDGQDYLTLFANDVTADRQAQEELALQREALRRTERLSAMGSLLAGVAHELNNPLAILLGRAELMLQKSKAGEGRGDVEKLHAAAERCARVVRSFLSMARQRPSSRRPACVRELVLEVVDLIGYGTSTAGIDIEVDVPPDLPRPSVDADQVAQVLVNLLVNAKHAVSSLLGERQIRVSALVDKQYVLIAVSDNGPGVPTDLRERIFDPYFTTKPEGVGTGIGLYVSQTIAREHGGSLMLHPSPALGATFELRLPI